MFNINMEDPFADLFNLGEIFYYIMGNKMKSTGFADDMGFFLVTDQNIYYLVINLIVLF